MRSKRLTAPSALHPISIEKFLETIVSMIPFIGWPLRFDVWQRQAALNDTKNLQKFPYDFNTLHMAHRYTLFPPGSQVGPLGPYGKCECGRWEHDTTPALPCPNAATVTGNIYIHQQVSLLYSHPFSPIHSCKSTFIEDFKRISCGEMRLCADFNVS